MPNKITLEPSHVQQPDHHPNCSVLRLPAVTKRTGLCRSTIHERAQTGEFPKQVNLGGRSVGCLESDIDAWIEPRVAASRQRSASA